MNILILLRRNSIIWNGSSLCYEHILSFTDLSAPEIVAENLDKKTIKATIILPRKMSLQITSKLSLIIG